MKPSFESKPVSLGSCWNCGESFKQIFWDPAQGPPPTDEVRLHVSLCLRCDAPSTIELGTARKPTKSELIAVVGKMLPGQAALHALLKEIIK